MIPRTITATTPLELAALRAVFDVAEGGWFSYFTDDVMYHLYKELGLINDDAGAQLDIDELSELMVRWARSVNYE